MPEVLDLRSHREQPANISTDSTSPAQSQIPSDYMVAGPSTLFDRCWRQYALCREYLFTDHTHQIASALTSVLDGHKPCHLVEAGCGPGFYSRRLAATISPAAHHRHRSLRTPPLPRPGTSPPLRPQQLQLPQGRRALARRVSRPDRRRDRFAAVSHPRAAHPCSRRDLHRAPPRRHLLHRRAGIGVARLSTVDPDEDHRTPRPFASLWRGFTSVSCLHRKRISGPH